MKAFWRSAVAAVFAVAMLPLAAQQQGPIETRLEARKVVVGADGKEGFAPAEAARPGDLIEYVATYRNTSKQPVRDLEATLPIPHNTEFVAGTARPATARAAVDLRAFGDLPLKRKVRRNGQEVEEQVPLRDYRYLRWFPGELAGGAAVSFTARVRVIDDRPPSEPGRQGGRK